MTTDGHLSPEQLSAYLARPRDASDDVVEHLARCTECRHEMMEVSAYTGRRPAATRLWAPALAAAVVLAIAWPRLGMNTSRDAHRDPGIAAITAPRALSPVGPVDSIPGFAWSSTPGAEGYDVRLFDDQGTVLVQLGSTDTTAAVPDSVSLAAGRRYYWKVDARTDFGRRSSSELVEFSIRRPRGP
jgi:hypothetical protein